MISRIPQNNFPYIELKPRSDGLFPVLIHDHRFVMPAFARAILIQESAEGGLSYKVKKETLT